MNTPVEFLIVLAQAYPTLSLSIPGLAIISIKMEKLDSYIDEDGYNEIGSRKPRQCFGYQESSTGGCIDLDGRLTVDEWNELLERVAGQGMWDHESGIYVRPTSL